MSPEILSLIQSDRGWSHAMGLRLLSMDEKLVVVEFTVGPEHLNPVGIVHGGVFSGVVETVCSLGASVGVPSGKMVVGMENQTSFLRPVRAGVLHAEARPVHRGRTTHLWESTIVDSTARLVASGRVRLMVVDMPTASSNEQV